MKTLRNVGSRTYTIGSVVKTEVEGKKKIKSIGDVLHPGCSLDVEDALADKLAANYPKDLVIWAAPQPKAPEPASAPPSESSPGKSKGKGK